MKKKNLAVSIKQVCKKVVSLFNVVFCGFILSINSVYAEGSIQVVLMVLSHLFVIGY